MGSSNTYVLSYLSPIIERFTQKTPNIILDSEFKGKFNNCDQSLILTGSPFTNQITGIILNDNKDIIFSGNQDNAVSFSLRTENGQNRIYKTLDGHFGILMKLNNKYSKAHNFIILAGLTNEATSAAGYLLKSKWKSIVREIGSQDFIIVFKVEIPRQDHSLDILYKKPDFNLE